IPFRGNGENALFSGKYPPARQVPPIEDRLHPERPELDVAKRDLPLVQLQADAAAANRPDIGEVEDLLFVDLDNEVPAAGGDVNSLPIVAVKILACFLPSDETAGIERADTRPGNIQLVAILNRVGGNFGGSQEH